MIYHSASTAGETLDYALTRPVPADYERLIIQMKFYIEPEISCSRFLGNACFTQESIEEYRLTHDAQVLELTEMGMFIERHVNNGLWIDAPCGQYDVREKGVDFDIPVLAARLGATDVWEIDSTADVMKDRLMHTRTIIENEHYTLMSSSGETAQRMQEGIAVTATQDDLLGFLAKLSREQLHKPVAVYISALQPDAHYCNDEAFQKTIAIPYLTALYMEMERVLHTGDLLILNSADMLVAGLNQESFPHIHPSLALPPRGFSLMRQCPLNKVWAFLKE